MALECQHRLQDVLGALLREGRGKQIASAELGSPELTGELVLGGVFSLIRTRMLEGDPAALVELAPSLTAFIVASYLGLPVAKVELSESSVAEGEAASPSGELPILFTHRTTLVLRAIAASPRSSNAAIARAAGLTDEGQMSKLLKRLEHRGLIEHVTPERGSRRLKAWLITPTGRRVLLSFGSDPDAAPRRSPTTGLGARMIFEPAVCRARQAHASAERARRSVALRARARVANKRLPMRGPLAPAAVTSAHRFGGPLVFFGCAASTDRRPGPLRRSAASIV